MTLATADTTSISTTADVEQQTPAGPTFAPKNQCFIWAPYYEGLFWMFKRNDYDVYIFNIETENADRFRERYFKEVKRCMRWALFSAMDPRYYTSGNDTDRNLPFALISVNQQIKGGCIESAIHKAGGPSDIRCYVDDRRPHNLGFHTLEQKKIEPFTTLAKIRSYTHNTYKKWHEYPPQSLGPDGFQGRMREAVWGNRRRMQGNETVYNGKFHFSDGTEEFRT